MAERRMYTKKITDSDAFIEMSSAAQALYFHLNQGADDDGFNNQIQMAMLKAHASTDDLKILMAKNFVIRFESGVIVIKHWRMHNSIRKDRYTPTNYQEELLQLGIKENGSYTLGCQMVAERLTSGCQVVDAGKVSEGKVSEGKLSVVEGSSADGIPDGIPKDTDTALPEINHFSVLEPFKYNNIFLTDEQIAYLLEDLKMEIHVFDDYVDRLANWKKDKNATVKSDFQTIVKWYKEDSGVI